MTNALAIHGGRPVAADFARPDGLLRCTELERQYLLEAHASGQWDDWPGTGSVAERFAREFARFNDAAFCALVANGTQAIQLALEVLDIGVGDEVIVPGLTWQATAAAVCDVNAVPVLVDVEPDTMCIDPDRVEQAIGPRTRAIIAVHLYARAADVARLRALADRHGVAFIEDCAHAHGTRWMSKGAGTIGDVGTYSFQASKVMSAGEGGAVLLSNEQLYGRVLSARAGGRMLRAGVRLHGGNMRMTSLQAAVLLGQLEALALNAAAFHRRGIALDAAVRAAPGVTPLRASEGVTRQCGYGYAFLYDAEYFDGLDVAVFRTALAAELGVSFGAPYAPLSHSEFYFPHTKARHRLSADYLRQIDPSSAELPVAMRLWRKQAVVAGWSIFRCASERASLLGDAIEKIYTLRADLLESAAPLRC